MRALLAVTALAIAGCAGCAACASGRPPGAAGRGTIVGVVDGDTVDVVIGGTEERVRLLGIDTPESRVEVGPPECFGPEAAALTARLLPIGTAVRLERDVVGRDDYGRLLAYVYREPDDLLVNEELVRLGYAEILRIEPNGILNGQLVAAAQAAERAGLGLWAACGG